MKHAALFLLALSACATHRESAVQVDAAAQQETQSHATESLEVHRIEEPSRVTTTVAEFEGSDARGDSPVAGKPDPTRAPDPSDVPATLPLHGKLIRLTTRIDERGLVRQDTSAQGSQTSQGAAREALSGKGDSEADSKPKLFSLGLGLSAGLILAGVAVLLIFTRGLWLPFLAKHLFGGGT